MNVKKKRVLFVIQEYTQGGINKCLENMLSFLDDSNFEIYIYCLYEDGGDYYKQVFKNRTIQKSKLYTYVHDHPVTRKLMGAYNKLTGRYNFGWLYKREARLLQKKYNFDTVIAYHEGPTVEFASYFEGVKKVTWVHCDPKVLLPYLFEDFKEYYLKMDAIIGVSNVVKQSIQELFPEYEGDVKVIHNLVDTNLIRTKAKGTLDDFSYSGENFKILSIGRSTKVKRFEKIPAIVRQMIDNGVSNIKWYIITSGNECNNDILQAIKEYKVQNYVVFLGEKNNPYPYIANANLLVSTSYTEAYPTVINEALTLGTPVLSNDYPSAKEIIPEGCGLTCPLNEMPFTINSLIANKEGLYTKLKAYTRTFQYPNEKIILQVKKSIVTEEK